MPKVGERFTINIGGTALVDAYWRGEFSMDGGDTYWVFQYGRSMYVKPKSMFKTEGKAVRLVPPEGVQK